VKALLAFAILPTLFWDGGPDTSSALRNAHIDSIRVPAASVEPWLKVPGIASEPGDPEHAVKLIVPGVEYLSYDASATHAPYINSNGSRYLRNPGAQFFLNAPGAAAVLAAAEGYMFAAAPMIKTDADALAPLGEMLAFLKTLPQERWPALANVGFIDDGSPASAERMNLMIVRNLLFRRLAAPDLALDLMVRPGSTDFPEAAWQNPDLLEHVMRSKLTDEKRLVRVYGSDVVIARLEGNESELQLHLLNYAAGERHPQSVRIRVLGKWQGHKLCAFGEPDARLADYAVASDATEFTLPELKTYAVVILGRFAAPRTANP
jgi:hypothetical protein